MICHFELPKCQDDRINCFMSKQVGIAGAARRLGRMGGKGLPYLFPSHPQPFLTYPSPCRRALWP